MDSYLNPKYAMDVKNARQESKGFHISINNLGNGRYQVKRFIYNRENSGIVKNTLNSGFADWSEPDMYEFLHSNSGNDLEIGEGNCIKPLNVACIYPKQAVLSRISWCK